MTAFGMDQDSSGAAFLQQPSMNCLKGMEITLYVKVLFCNYCRIDIFYPSAASGATLS
jgi:hypothetical protein